MGQNRPFNVNQGGEQRPAHARGGGAAIAKRGGKQQGRARLCWGCNSPSHLYRNCPHRNDADAMATMQGDGEHVYMAELTDTRSRKEKQKE